MSIEKQSLELEGRTVPIPRMKQRPKPTFLGDDYEETVNGGSKEAHRMRIGDDEIGFDQAEIDDLFKEAEDDLALPEPLDHEAIEESIRRTTKSIEDDPFALSSSNQNNESSKKVTKRRKVVKLDEQRLLDEKFGIPKLIKISKGFKPSSSKGNEKDDLKRILKIYRIWSHEMFPKSSFTESIDQIEKLGQKRSIKVAMKHWREESSMGTTTKNNSKKKRSKDFNDESTTENNRTLTKLKTLPAENFTDLQGSNGNDSTEKDRSNIPLFREAEDDEEFPLEDDLANVFEQLDQQEPNKNPSNPQINKTQSGLATQAVEKLNEQTNLNSKDGNFDYNFSEEEALLREFENNDEEHNLGSKKSHVKGNEERIVEQDNSANKSHGLFVEEHDEDDLYQ